MCTVKLIAPVSSATVQSMRNAWGWSRLRWWSSHAFLPLHRHFAFSLRSGLSNHHLVAVEVIVASDFIWLSNSKQPCRINSGSLIISLLLVSVNILFWIQCGSVSHKEIHQSFPPNNSSPLNQSHRVFYNQASLCQMNTKTSFSLSSSFGLWILYTSNFCRQFHAYQSPSTLTENS